MLRHPNPSVESAQSLAIRHESFLDASIDQAAHDGQKTVVARVTIMALLACLMAANIGLPDAVAWLFIGLACELCCRRSSLALRPGGVTPRRARLIYLLWAAALTIVWVYLPSTLWFTGQPALGAAAILILATHLVHAQAFTYRSTPVLAISGGIPAATLLALPWLSGPFTGVELVTLTMVSVLAIFYVVASVHANRATARSLKHAQDELERFAYFDALTSLANRRLFSDHLRKLIALSRRRGTRFALLLLDLDRFKDVNDTLGHDAGDALLVEVGVRLRHAVRAHDHVARLGGDEFAILLPVWGDASEIEAVCARIATSFTDGIEFDGKIMSSTPSVGMALFPDHGDKQESLYKSADLALYEAKRSGRNTWRYSGTGWGKLGTDPAASPAAAA